MEKIVDLRDATITVSDGADTPKTATLRIGEGAFSFKQGSEKEYITDAGKLWKVKDGDEMTVEVNFDFVWLHSHGEAGKTFEDILLGNNGCESVDSDACAPYACDIAVNCTAVCGNVSYYDNYDVSDFRVEPQTFDMKEGKVTLDGKANITEVPHTQSSASSSSSSSATA
jgi:hypothetical protein